MTKDLTFFTGTRRRLCSLRMVFENIETAEKTSVYLTQTDKNKFRVKVFRGGKCIMANYTEAASFAELLTKIYMV